MARICKFLVFLARYATSYNKGTTLREDFPDPATGNLDARGFGDDIILCVFASTYVFVDGHGIVELDVDAFHHGTYWSPGAVYRIYFDAKD